MNDVRYLEVAADEEGQRLDNYLFRVLKGVPKSHIYRIVRSGEVRVNKKRAQVSQRLCPGDSIRIPPLRVSLPKPIVLGSRLALELVSSILYEDEHLLVVNKPAGVAVHGGSGVSLGVIEALRQARKDLHYLELVHRLDKETSGCLLLAKKRSTLRGIQALLEARKVEKTYWALLANAWLDEPSLWVDEPLEKNILKSGERIVTVSSQGKPSQTYFQLLRNYRECCWVEARPKTGRTHQIRVHSAFLGHPILGDTKYGKIKIEHKKRLCLHARSIRFNLSGRDYYFEVDLDEELTRILKDCEKEESIKG